MSAELVIIIIGIAFLLIAIADNIKTLNLINTKLRIPLGILGVLLIIYGGYSYGSIVNFGQIEQAELGNKSKINLPIEKVQVISPVAGDSVDCRILTMGVYPDSHEKDIWVLLKPSNNKFYPQSDHTNTSYKRNGEWQVITRFGGDKGESYEIIIYEADAAASQYFSSTIEKWKELDSYPGLSDEEIPRSANEVDRITVSLKENCRGVF
ncbi:hypothetical protein [Litoribaculum gwangyangense]|uniref:DUF2892 domain-containing protein n=1 Tax=Litoribaculum gwangyangense TaxID=1130722 RepID=A0ABP9CSS9_9FLAO